MENWRPVLDWPSYEVSDLGNVRRVNGNRLRPIPTAAGYLRVHLSERGFRRKIPIHRLVCLAFNGPPPEGRTDVLHGDLGRAVNIPSNLRWGDDRMNYADRRQFGEGGLLDRFHHRPGELHRFVRLSSFDIEEIRRLAGSLSQRVIAERFRINQGHVSNIVNFKRWRTI
jgi:hypothetical protein